MLIVSDGGLRKSSILAFWLFPVRESTWPVVKALHLSAGMSPLAVRSMAISPKVWLGATTA